MMIAASALAGFTLSIGIAEILKTMSKSRLQAQEPGLTVKWGEDLIREAYTNPTPDVPADESKPAKLHIVYVQVHPQGRSYEFGLRSDGVVVWREVR